MTKYNNTTEIQNSKTGKTVKESEAETTLVMLPSDANPLAMFLEE